MEFVYETAPTRVVFGRGTVRTALPGEIDRLGASRVMVLTGKVHQSLAHTAVTPFADAVVSFFADAEEHVPAPVADRAVARARDARPDLLLSLGGGSATGTAKIVARDLRVPILAVPTTYAGSEATPVWGLTREGRKETGEDAAVRPRTVVLDPDLTDQLPRTLAVASGINALAHAVEAYWAPGANPISSAMADEAVRALAAGLRGVGPEGLARAQAPENALTDPVGVWAGTPTAAGEQLLYGAYLAGATLAAAGSGLHHKICHVLGGAFNLPHAALHAVVLPHVLALNAPAVPAVAGRIARALDADEAVSGLRGLAASVAAPRTLAQIGLHFRQLDEAVDRVSATLPIDNPRPVGKNEVRAVLTAAYGERAA
ncbi:maleylacetate reductase [Georgenia subflava]|uniref:Iron-containing alcohol dehydrogenase n=1 Tax=Georgenia subflava TaxID=1622177 RepID=A0A6N7EDF4_9MICO|nr:maleylacetate reductase [Georgenia subflava]MPV36030.1 iron-containing alcohol dehydrogenase [Georgenia subflava]